MIKFVVVVVVLVLLPLFVGVCFYGITCSLLQERELDVLAA